MRFAAPPVRLLFSRMGKPSVGGSMAYSIKLSDGAVGELLKRSRSQVWRMKSKLLSALREKPNRFLPE